MKKPCIKCGVPRELTEFYRHPGMADGRLNKCKECHRLDVKENRKRNIEYYRAYDRDRGNRQNNEYVRDYRARNPEKYKAHRALNNAVRDGKIVKPTHCTKCGKETTLHGHHHDYAQPLNVEWLCPACHHGG
jgi:hypothetical protein